MAFVPGDIPMSSHENVGFRSAKKIRALSGAYRNTYGIWCGIALFSVFCVIHALTFACKTVTRFKQEFVRPRWPYDMRPSVCAEKYGCRQCVPKSTCVSL